MLPFSPLPAPGTTNTEKARCRAAFGTTEKLGEDFGLQIPWLKHEPAQHDSFVGVWNIEA
jgi:hypothetical protein